MGDHEIKWEGKTLPNLDCADDLSILDKSVSEINELLEVFKVQGTRIGYFCSIICQYDRSVEDVRSKIAKT